jgi:death-on-curing family protein
VADTSNSDAGPHPTQIEFLTFEDVCAIHDRGLIQFGEGAPGIISEHSIRSAMAQPEAGIDGRYFHTFPAGMAAAYLYYLTRQQGFVNGNKRAAVGSALEFLARNGYELNASSYELYTTVIRLAGEDVKRERELALHELEIWIAERLSPSA